MAGKDTSVLLFGSYRYPMYEEACARALEQIGVRVIRLASEEATSAGGLCGRAQRWFASGPIIAKPNRRLIDAVEKDRPDITLVYNNHYVKPATLARLSGKTWLAGYTNDNPFGAFAWRPFWRNLRKTIPCYDSWHVYRRSNIGQFRRAGAENVGLLMSYYLPWDVPQDCLRPRTAFDYDVVFVGHGETDGRADHVRALLDAGVDLRIFGPPAYWRRCLGRRDLRRIPKIEPLRREEYRDVIRKSKICLAFLSGGNRDEYTRRCFEIPSWGGFMLAQRTGVLQELYQEGQDAEYFDSAVELIAECKKYLDDDEGREKIAASGQRRCLEDGHDVASRMRQWLGDIEEFRGKPRRRLLPSAPGRLAHSGLNDGRSSDGIAMQVAQA